MIFERGGNIAIGEGEPQGECVLREVNEGVAASDVKIEVWEGWEGFVVLIIFERREPESEFADSISGFEDIDAEDIIEEDIFRECGGMDGFTQGGTNGGEDAVQEFSGFLKEGAGSGGHIEYFDIGEF